MRKYKVLIFSALATVMSLSLLAGCGKEDVVKKSAESDVTIIYTNDIHSYIDNVSRDEEGNVIGHGLRLSKIAGMANDMRAAGGNVILVDNGDLIQGDIYGAIDEGETMMKLMEAAGYQVATPGNHDFDYGLQHFIDMEEESSIYYITCNFHSSVTREVLFPPTYILDAGDKRVAFVGVTTPDVMTSSTPTFFQNEDGEYIYTVDGLTDKNDLYTSVQNAIDSVKDQADYVIAIGHVGVGVDEAKNEWDSKSIIKNVSGLDAFIDGNSHTIMEGETVSDKDGNKVVLTQAGSCLERVGVLTISEKGKISTTLLEDYDGEDESVLKLEQDWMYEVNSQMGEKIGTLEKNLYINNPEKEEERLIRNQELNLGDFVADSIYWFFNDRLGLECDVVFQNGGGIRSGIESGDLTYYSAKQVSPFSDMVCMIHATGQQIVDALEVGASVTGEWNNDTNAPAETGSFMQVAGLSYTIDAKIPSSVDLDKNGMFKKVTDEYRVKNVEIYNRELGIYEPIDLEKEYTVGGIDYILRNDGNGLTMFDGCKLAVESIGLDYVILAEYIKSFEGDLGYPVVNTDNSPLAKYKGYLLNYESPYGAGRIKIFK